MKKVAFLSPNLDTFSNPTLLHLFEKLIEKNYRIIFIGFDQIFIPKHIIDNLEFMEMPFNFYKFKFSFWNIIKLVRQYYNLFRKLKIENKIDTMICVDPMGIVIAGRIRRLIKFKLIYASFEIFFKEEFTIPRKKIIKEHELVYSKYADMIIIQDPRREKLLREVNNFRPDAEIKRIPVSPVPVNNVSNANDIYKLLNIPTEKNIVIYSGTLEKWSGIYDILDLFPGQWNNGNWLVIHSHKKLQEDSNLMKRINELIDRKCNISFHNKPFYDNMEYFSFLSKCKIGIALYYPNDEDIFSGKNIEFIGLSSGKFSTYMMLGIPTITTSNPIYVTLNEKYHFGKTIKTLNDFPDAVNMINLEYEQMKSGCKEVYAQVLNPEKELGEVVKYIEEQSNK
ncbi:MAG: hypothetical protein HGGPFJEG_01310 [Ignavibacteria bacterium]|nr:hypothetical protein [Ignavibacteria bacterium]